VKKFVLLALSVVLLGSPAMAKDLRFTTSITQGQFKDFSKEAGAAFSYRTLAPTAPLGVLGFDAGIEASAADIDTHSAYWESAFGNDAPDYLWFPRVRGRLGLPLGVDIGAMYSFVPDSNIKVFGFELSKSILDGSAATPALGIRGGYTRLAGVDDLELQTASIDLSISKGILFLTPYAGAGAVWVNSTAHNDFESMSRVTPETIWQPRVFAGIKVSPLPLFALTAEVEYQVRPIYSLKVAAGF
jgi:opacity protein-like surface antigen